MPTAKLIGRDNVAPGTNESANQLVLTKFTALGTGNMTEFCARCSASGNIKGAIYSDSAGSPAALLNSIGSTAVVSGWNVIAFPSTSLTKDTAYWLAILVSAAGVAGAVNETAVRKYKAWPYADPFPNPAGTGYTDETTWQNIIAGWGNVLQSVLPSGISTAEALGGSQVNFITKPSGIETVEAFGTLLMFYDQVLTPSGVVSGEAFGTLITVLFLLPAGIATEEALGSPTICWVLNPDGIIGGEAFGTAQLNLHLLMAAIASSETFGTSKLALYLVTSGIASLEAVGMPQINHNVILTGIASAEAFGSIGFGFYISPLEIFLGSGVVSADSFAQVDYFHLSKFTAQFSGSVTRILVNSKGSASVKVAIYTDNAGEPNALLNAINTSIALAAGWNIIPFPATIVVQGVDYWLAFNSG